MHGPRFGAGAFGLSVLWACISAPLGAQASVDLSFTDLTPRFLAFYDSATARHPLDPEERWALWGRLYGFAAVPPTPAGRARARELLDERWERYAEVVPRLRQGGAPWSATPAEVMERVNSLLGCGAPVKVRVTAFVGMFDGNAFTFSTPDGVLNVAAPVEAGDGEGSLAHELTHAVHAACSGAGVSYVQPLARLVLAEGIAMRAVAALLPERGEERALKGAPKWVEACRKQGAQVVRGVLVHLEAAEQATVERFTSGEGSTGLDREAYCAGWVVVGALLDAGMSLREMASLPPEQAATLVRRGAGVAPR